MAKSDGMKIYKDHSVFEESLNRIRWLFDEFENVIVSYSGGKDSTVVFELSLMIAREKGRLPLKVLFLDQEAEWDATIEQVRNVMYHPDVHPLWYQIPFRLFNATSSMEHWLKCWDPEDEARWIRPKDPISIKENVYKCDRFVKLFAAIMDHDYHGQGACYIAGVRTEESPSRFVGLTSSPAYKWATWGKGPTRRGQKHFTMYPIYDWSLTDVWKCIHDNKWPYCTLYDVMYQYGVPLRNMRVSNVHHETAVRSLWYLQEVEPETYERLVNRISGIDMAGKMGRDNYFVKELPFMFSSWKEYRDYLLEKLITVDSWKDGFRKVFERHERLYVPQMGDEPYRVHVQSILTNDWEFIKINNWEHTLPCYLIRKGEKQWSK